MVILYMLTSSHPEVEQRGKEKGVVKRRAVWRVVRDESSCSWNTDLKMTTAEDVRDKRRERRWHRGKDEENGEREDGNERLKEQERFEKLYNLKEKKSWWQVPLVKGSAKVSVTLALSFMEFYWSKLSLLAYCDSRRINEPDKTN